MSLTLEKQLKGVVLAAKTGDPQSDKESYLDVEYVVRVQVGGCGQGESFQITVAEHTVAGVTIAERKLDVLGEGNPLADTSVEITACHCMTKHRHYRGSA